MDLPNPLGWAAFDDARLVRRFCWSTRRDAVSAVFPCELVKQSPNSASRLALVSGNATPRGLVGSFFLFLTRPA